MRLSPDQVGSRRDFFRAAARYAVLGGIGVVMALMGKRRLEGQRCVNRGICGGCSEFPTCGLPAALSAKQAQAGG